MQRTSERVIALMRQEPNKKYKSVEISKKLKIGDGIARRALSQLMYHKEVDSISDGTNRFYFIKENVETL